MCHYCPDFVDFCLFDFLDLVGNLYYQFHCNGIASDHLVLSTKQSRNYGVDCGVFHSVHCVLVFGNLGTR